MARQHRSCRTEAACRCYPGGSPDRCRLRSAGPVLAAFGLAEERVRDLEIYPSSLLERSQDVKVPSAAPRTAQNTLDAAGNAPECELARVAALWPPWPLIGQPAGSKQDAISPRTSTSSTTSAVRIFAT